MAITFSPSSLSFGNVAVNQSVTLQVTVSNSDPTNTVSLTGPSGSFSMSPTPVTVPAGGTATMAVTFSPTAPGGSSSSITGGGVTCSLSGTGQQGLWFYLHGSQSQISTQDLGTVVVGNSGTVTLSVSNMGAQCTLQTATGAFTLSPSPAKVPASPGGSYAGFLDPLTVTFTPTGAGPYSDKIEGPGGSLALTGTGQAALTFDQNPLQVGTCAVNGNVSATVNVTNASNVVQALTVAGPFTVTSPSPAQVAANATSVPVVVQFNPTAVGAASGTLSGGGASCTLNGTGTAVLTFHPSAVDFGGVSLGQTGTKTITVDNASGAAVDLSFASPFAVTSPSPARVPANASGLSLTVTFTPTAATSYKGALTATGAVCPLTGYSTEPDRFESDEDTTQGTATPGGDPNTRGTKYYQIAVPNFQEGTSPGPNFANVVTATGSNAGDVPSLSSASSFLRLGSPPDPTSDWPQSLFQNSVNLARLVGDAWVIAAAENMTLSGPDHTGTTVVASVVDSSTASSIVPTSADTALGTASATAPSGWSSNFADGGGNPTITNDDANTFGALYTVGDGTTFGNAFNTNQDASYLPGFADDTRQRGQLPGAAGNYGANTTCPATTNVSNVAVDNVAQNRQAETLKLLSKGGWWDHSDGNRITTTSGDKIEVIGGNYKLVVLGRQAVPTPPSASPAPADVDNYRKQLTALAGNAFVTDVSGGHFQEQYPSPTPCIKTIEYVQDANGEWTLYQDNGIGNLVTKLKGRTVDLFQGVSRETYVGSNNAGTDSTTGIALDPQLASYTWAKSVFSQTGSEDKPIGASASSSSPSSSTGPQPSGVSNGDVVSKTWANRVYSYTGSSTTKVSYVRSETHASASSGEAIHSLTKAYNGDIYSEVNASFGKIQNVSTAAVITNVATAKGAIANVTAAGGDVVNVTAAPMALNLTTAAGVVNMTAALDVVNFTAAASIVNINLGLGMDTVDLTPGNYHWGVTQVDLAAWKSNIAARVDMGLSPQVTGAAGALDGVNAAFKVLATAGAVGALAIGGLGIGIGESLGPT
jgi:hypothetical protein